MKELKEEILIVLILIGILSYKWLYNTSVTLGAVIILSNYILNLDMPNDWALVYSIVYGFLLLCVEIYRVHRSITTN